MPADELGSQPPALLLRPAGACNRGVWGQGDRSGHGECVPPLAARLHAAQRQRAVPEHAQQAAARRCKGRQRRPPTVQHHSLQLLLWCALGSQYPGHVAVANHRLCRGVAQKAQEGGSALLLLVVLAAIVVELGGGCR